MFLRILLFLFLAEAKKKRNYLHKFTTPIYPEFDILDIEQNSYGIAFSGGGHRAFTAAMGQLLALYELGLLDNKLTSHLSCTSGGCIATSVFNYNDDSTVKEKFCGINKNPRKITVEELNKPISNNCPLKIALKDINFFDYNTYLAKGEYKQPYIENFFKKNLFKKNCNNKYTLNYYKLSPQALSKPYSIFNLNCYGLLYHEGYPPFEITPFYSGIPLKPIVVHISEEKDGVKTENRNQEHIIIGGQWLDSEVLGNEAIEIKNRKDHTNIEVSNLQENFVFSNENETADYFKHKYLKKSNGKKEMMESYELRVIRTKNWMTPAHAVSYSVNIIEVLGLGEGINKHLVKNFKFPAYNAAQKFYFQSLRAGDAGYFENTSVLSLLRRKKKRIILFLNTGFAFKRKGEKMISDHLSSLFGIISNFLSRDIGKFDRNTVFEKTTYFELIEQFKQAEKNKSPLIAILKNVKVLENKDNGIEGGWRVKELVVFYLSISYDWIKELDPKVQKEIEQLKNFPCYKMIGNERLMRGFLSNKAIKALSSMTYYTTLHFLRKHFNMKRKEEVFEELLL